SFFTLPAPTSFYTLSLHDALPICGFTWERRLPWGRACRAFRAIWAWGIVARLLRARETAMFEAEALAPAAHWMHSRPSGCRRCSDRKSTRLNSSHLVISYAVFCLK